MQEGGRAEGWAGWDRAPPQRKRQTDGRLSMFDNIVDVNVLFWGGAEGSLRKRHTPISATFIQLFPKNSGGKK